MAPNQIPPKALEFCNKTKKRTKYQYEALTRRQTEIVRLLSLGCSIYEVGAILGLSPNTVDNTKTTAMKRMGCNKVALLTRLAMQLKISSMQDALTTREKRLSGRKNDGWN